MNDAERADASWLTLRAYWEQYHQPLFQIDAAPRTLLEYSYSLARWEWLTDNPPLARVTLQTLARFQTGLASLDGQDGQGERINSLLTDRKHV